MTSKFWKVYYSTFFEKDYIFGHTSGFFIMTMRLPTQQFR